MYLQIHNCQCGSVVNMHVFHNPTVFHKYLHKSVYLQYMASCNLQSNKNHPQNQQELFFYYTCTSLICLLESDHLGFPRRKLLYNLLVFPQGQDLSPDLGQGPQLSLWHIFSQRWFPQESFLPHGYKKKIKHFLWFCTLLTKIQNMNNGMVIDLTLIYACINQIKR